MGRTFNVLGGDRRLQVPNASSTLDFSNTNSKIKSLGISKQQLGALNPKHGALLCDCTGRTTMRAAMSCSLLPHSLCKDCSLCLQCSSPLSFPSAHPPLPHFPGRPASVPPPGLEAPESRNQVSAIQPQSTQSLSPRRRWLSAGVREGRRRMSY